MFEIIPNISKHLLDVPTIKIPNSKIIHIDSSKTANRSVISIISKSKKLKELIPFLKEISKDIDMNQHQTIHPTIGAIDVLPIVPLSNNQDLITNQLHHFAKELSNSLQIPIFLYANSHKQKQTLFQIRKGGYKNLYDRINQKQITPDFLPNTINKKLGGLCLSIRKPMIAFNVNLDTKSLSKAKTLATNLINYRNKNLKFKNVEFITWNQADFDLIQISTNIRDIDTANAVDTYYLIKQLALELNINLKGSELIGLTPKSGLLNKEYPDLNKNIKTLNLNSVKEFSTEKHLLENYFKDI